MLPLKHSPLALALACMLLVPAAAQARFMMLDAHFDQRTPGDSLARRGALFGEPVAGLFDLGGETIVEESAGDNAVRIADQAAEPLSPSFLYWALRDEREVSDGLLTLRFTVTPEQTDAYQVLITDAPGTLEFVVLDLDATGQITWRDLNTPGAAVFGSYTMNQELRFRLEFRLAQGTWNLFLDDVPVLVGEDLGFVGAPVARLVVGAAADTGPYGSLRFDDPQVDWRPGTAATLLRADFDDQPAGEVIGTGGAALGQPVFLSQCSPVVTEGVMVGNCLEILDESETSTGTARFEFLESVEIVDQPVSVSVWMVADVSDRYMLVFRERDSSTESLLGVKVVATDRLSIVDGIVGPHFVGSITPGVPFRVEIAFEMGLRIYSLWLDGERLLHRRPLGGDGDRGLGSLLVGYDYDAGFDGRLFVDDIRVHDLPSMVVAVDDHGLPPAPRATLLGAAPNPFNPRTEVRFALAAPGRARLDILDVRGRLVARLLDGHLPAGEHRTAWNGVDRAGRRVASGVYQARLTAGGEASSLPLTLLK
jgi:hypothetical protein